MNNKIIQDKLNNFLNNSELKVWVRIWKISIITLILLIFTLIVAFLTHTILIKYYGIDEALLVSSKSNNFIYTFIATCLFAPIFEEFFYRFNRLHDSKESILFKFSFVSTTFIFVQLNNFFKLESTLGYFLSILLVVFIILSNYFLFKNRISDYLVKDLNLLQNIMNFMFIVAHPFYTINNGIIFRYFLQNPLLSSLIFIANFYVFYLTTRLFTSIRNGNGSPRSNFRLAVYSHSLNNLIVLIIVYFL